MKHLLRRLARWYLFWYWKNNCITYGEYVRLNYWGATGNEKHHPLIWADFD